MSSRRRLVSLAIVLAACTAAPLVPTLARAQQPVVRQAPPAPRAETRPSHPAQGKFFWVPGVWQVERGAWVWRPGYWVRERPGWTWQRGQWVAVRDGYQYVPGKWVQNPPPARPPQAQVPPGSVNVPSRPRPDGGGRLPLPPVDQVVRLPRGLADGQPPSLQVGAPAGVWLWVDGRNVWHLVTTTAGRQRRFSGRLEPLGGATVRRLSSLDAEPIDQVWMRQGAVEFSFVTQGDVDGLQFRLRRGDCLRVYLQGDDARRQPRIIVGGQDFAVNGAVFDVCR